VKRKALATHLGLLLLAASFISGIAQAKQFVCTAAVAYSSEPDGKLRVKEGHLKGNQTVFTVDTSTGVVQGDQVVPLGTYTVAYPGTGADGAKLLRIDAARLQVIFVATNASSPYPFLFTDGVVTLAGTCRPSS
jgi:hypothetical protein